MRNSLRLSSRCLITFALFAMLASSPIWTETASAQVGFGTSQATSSSAPYYVDASRFQYNRPSSRVFGPSGVSSSGQPGRNFTIQVPRTRPFVYYPSPYFYYPQSRYYVPQTRYYSPQPGVTVHVGPFIPVRRF